MTKVYCGRYSCRFCVGEVCTKDIISVKDDGKCNSYGTPSYDTDAKIGNIVSKEYVSYRPRYGVKEDNK